MFSDFAFGQQQLQPRPTFGLNVPEPSNYQAIRPSKLGDFRVTPYDKRPPPVFFNFEIRNDTDGEIAIDKVVTPATELMPVPSMYRLSIVKFSLPSKTETFIIPDGSTDYQVKLSVNNNRGTLLTTTQSMFTRSQFKMFNINDFVDNFNRTMISAHTALLTQMAATDATVQYISNNAAGNVDLNAAAEQLVTLTFPSAIDTSSRVSMINIAITFAAVGDSDPMVPFQVFLESSNGTSVMLTGGRTLSYGTYTFSDASIATQSGLATLPAGTYQPLEPFNKISTNNTVPSLAWRLRFRRTTDDFTGPTKNTTFSVAPVATLLFSPLVNPAGLDLQSLFPWVPPALYFDQNAKKISLIIQDRHTASGLTIGLSSKLYSVLPLLASSDATGTFFNVKIPQGAFVSSVTSSDFNIASIIPADQADVYKMLDISQIIITTTLAIVSEYDALTNSPILMSLDVAGDDLASSFFQFANNNVSTRSYQVLQDSPLVNLGIKIAYKYRSTGEIVTAMLPRNTTFTMLLKFTPIGDAA